MPYNALGQITKQTCKCIAVHGQNRVKCIYIYLPVAAPRLEVPGIEVSEEVWEMGAEAETASGAVEVLDISRLDAEKEEAASLLATDPASL